MSVPRDILDQLLSGYLDDALSSDERSQVERLLRDDPAVAQELSGLRTLRDDLREISRADSGRRLDDRFADRVLEAAMEQAQSEGLSEDHPLIRLAEQPAVTQRSSPLPAATWKTVAGVLALAATIAFAMFVFGPSKDPGPGGIAKLNNPGLNNPDSDDPDQVNPNAGNQGTPSSISADPTPDQIVKAPSIQTNGPETSNPESTNPNTGNPNVGPNQRDPKEMIASTDAASKGTSEVNASPSSPDTAVKQGNGGLPLTEADMIAMLRSGVHPIMAFEIRRTESGRLSRAVREAMKIAGIKAADEKAITNEMVGQVANSVKNDDDLGGTQILYLEVSGKKVDVLTSHLLADNEGIESLGYNMVFTPAVQSFIKSARSVVATEVRQDVSWDLRGGAVNVLIRELNTQKFSRIKKTFTAKQSGADQLSQLLILIR